MIDEYSNKIVAIDGPSGSGKGAVSAGLAEKFSFFHLDTGLFFRAYAFCLLNNEKIDINKINEVIDNYKSELKLEPVSKKASEIAKLIDVRQMLKNLQHAVVCDIFKKCEYRGVVADGRDVGTVIFPKAKCKIFLSAKLEIRAQRRFKELVCNDDSISFDGVYENLSERDQQDSKREIAPLRLDKSYEFVDNSDMTLLQSIEFISKIVKNKLKI